MAPRITEEITSPDPDPILSEMREIAARLRMEETGVDPATPLIGPVEVPFKLVFYYPEYLDFSRTDADVALDQLIEEIPHIEGPNSIRLSLRKINRRIRETFRNRVWRGSINLRLIIRGLRTIPTNQEIHHLTNLVAELAIVIIQDQVDEETTEPYQAWAEIETSDEVNLRTGEIRGQREQETRNQGPQLRRTENM